MKAFSILFKNPYRAAAVLAWKARWIIPDKLYLKIIFRSKMGRRLNLIDPKTYSEKLQWLKLYDRRPEYTRMVDKYEAKQYVADIIGEEYVIPTLGVWNKPEEIEWDRLPDQFVLKCTHDSGGIVICRNKADFNKGKAISSLKKSLSNNFYIIGREWPYKKIHPRIIAEKYMEDTKTKELRDYKFFCFDGAVKALFIATERQKEGEDVKFDFFDADFNHLPFLQGHDNAAVMPEKPSQFEKMKTIAAELSKGIPQVRVDLYEVDGRVYFGELTFFHHGGWTPFEPEEWDYKFGKEIRLPSKKN